MVSRVHHRTWFLLRFFKFFQLWFQICEKLSRFGFFALKFFDYLNRSCIIPCFLFIVNKFLKIVKSSINPDFSLRKVIKMFVHVSWHVLTLTNNALNDLRPLSLLHRNVTFLSWRINVKWRQWNWLIHHWTFFCSFHKFINIHDGFINSLVRLLEQGFVVSSSFLSPFGRYRPVDQRLIKFFIFSLLLFQFFKLFKSVFKFLINIQRSTDSICWQVL